MTRTPDEKLMAESHNTLSDKALSEWLRGWVAKNVTPGRAVWDLMFDIAARLESRATSADVERLQTLLDWRDEFIVERGLWSAFTAWHAKRDEPRAALGRAGQGGRGK